MTVPRQFATQEIGSIAKPGWRVKYRQGKKIEDKDLSEARKWGKKIGIPAAEQETLGKLLRKRTRSAKDKKAVEDFSALYGIRFLEASGLDLVWDGEQRRAEMYQYPIENAKGFKFLGHVRSWDNKYYLKAACVATPGLKKPYHTSEFDFIRTNARREIKVPVTGAFTLADWSFNEFYERKLAHGDRLSKQARHDAKRELAVAIAKNLVRPTVEALVKAGATRIQIDEPAATTKYDETDIFVESFEETVRGLPGYHSVHLCFSEYKRLFPQILEMRSCKQYAMEFANRDSRKPGTRREDRPGYAFLELMEEYNDDRAVGLGVLDVHSDFVETPELVRDRLLYAADKLGAERVFANPDCGLRTRTWETTFAKLAALAEGAQRARKSL
ncbi:MAG TPA: hypothetical protein VM681_11280 [Candidatus Thermoplasmatota archaeon]|nr:hypothetical protein [Candidatus Thermoplasmatota archaeon]